jgi:thymidine kinase
LFIIETDAFIKCLFFLITLAKITKIYIANFEIKIKKIYKPKYKERIIMPSFELRHSTMGSGKTRDLFSIKRNYKDLGMSVVIFKSIIDTRSRKGQIRSRSGEKARAITITDTDNIFEIVKNRPKKPKCVLVDEIHFFEEHHIRELSDIVDKLGIPVIAYGILADFKGCLFPVFQKTLILFDKIAEYPQTVCWCGKKATMHLKTVDEKVIREGDAIQVGDIKTKKKSKVVYHPVCRRHWKQGRFFKRQKKSKKK